MNILLEKAKKIKCLICDVDGVMTDGSLYLDNNGNELKAFQVQDGMGLKLLMAADITVAVITTSRHSIIEHRMKQLGIHHYFTGQVDKQRAFSTLKEQLQLTNEEFAYVGDDLPDRPIMQQVGLSCAVANAVKEIKEFADYETINSGGHGAVREVTDIILAAQNKLEEALAKYLQS